MHFMKPRTQDEKKLFGRAKNGEKSEKWQFDIMISTGSYNTAHSHSKTRITESCGQW